MTTKPHHRIYAAMECESVVKLVALLGISGKILVMKL